MKKILMAAVAMFLTAGLIQAQQTQDEKTSLKAGGETIKSTPSKCDMKNCCMMKDGKMVSVKDGKEMAMEADMKTKDGTLITKNGVVVKDGKKIMMKNGDCIDITNGHMSMMENQANEKDPAKAVQPVKSTLEENPAAK